MLKFLTLLLELVARFFEEKDKAGHKQQGRREAVEEVNNAIEERVERAEAAISVPDPERDERLRSRFDRSRTGK